MYRNHLALAGMLLFNGVVSAATAESNPPATERVGIEKFSEFSDERLRRQDGSLDIELGFPADERYPNKLAWYFLQTDYVLRAYFENGKSNRITPKLSVGYEGSDVRMPKLNNRYAIIEEDLTGDDINELIYLVVAYDEPFVSQEVNIFRYRAPLNLSDVGDPSSWRLVKTQNFGKWFGKPNISIESRSIVVRGRNSCTAVTWAVNKFVTSDCF